MSAEIDRTLGTIPPGEIVRDDFVAARAPWSAIVAAGDVLSIIDLGGNQAVDCILYAAADTSERYSAPDTIAAQEKNDIGKKGAARGRLRAAAGQLRAFGFIVRSLQGRLFLSTGLIDQLAGTANGIREDTLALRKSL